MGTSLTKISNILGTYKPSVRIHCKESSIIDAVDFLHSSRKTFQSNILYLGKTSDLSLLSEISIPLNILMVADYPLKLEGINNSLFNLVILDHFYDLEILHEEIFNYLKSQQDFLQKSFTLYECMASGRGLQGMVDTAAELLGNPIVVSDVGFKILAHSQHDLIEDSLWSKIFEKGFVPYETMMKLKKYGIVEKLRKAQYPEMVYLPYAKNRLLLWKTTTNDEIICYISVSESFKPIEENDLELLTILSRLISIELQKCKNSAQTKEGLFQHLINGLLDEILYTKEHLKEVIKYLDLKMDSNFFILVAKFGVKSSEKMPLSYVSGILEQIVSSSKCAIYENKIIMLITRNKKALFSKNELENLNKFLKGNEIIVGVSRDFSDIFITRDYYIQSCKAIELGMRLDVGKNIYFYEDYFEFHLLDMASKTEDIKKICNPLIFKLLEYDSINNCDFVASLYAYLASGSNLTQAAKKFGLHRNSMDYRIKKIEEVLDVNLNDPNVTFSLNISMRIMQFFEGKSFFENYRSSNKAVN